MQPQISRGAFVRQFFIAVFLLGASSSVWAQITDASICDILANPPAFDGKMVRVKGVVAAGFDEFVVRDTTCNQSTNAIWLAYPEGSKGKAGPAALIQLQLAKNNSAAVEVPGRASVKLDKTKDFKQFDSLLSNPYKSGGMCLGCVRNTVSATLTGRLDGVKQTGVVRDNNGRFAAVNGFGNLNGYPARLVLQSVSEVSGHEVDYSKLGSAAKDDASGESPAGDPVAAAHLAARAFDAGSEAAKQLERAASAYGNQGDDNGVEVGFGIANEVLKGDGGKGTSNSPDGLLLNCTFDMDRLHGQALSRAMAHIGTHIADIRDPQPPALDSYTLEYRAWQTTVFSAVATQQKTLTSPGGYLVWNSAWPASDRGKMVDGGITRFLVGWMLLKH